MGHAVDELHLTVGSLRYQTRDTDLSREGWRARTASGFLVGLRSPVAAGAEPAPRARRVSVKVVSPARFSPPADAARPVVMFAGGTGIAPMRGLLDERMRDPEAGTTQLFFAARERGDLYYRDELERFAASGRLRPRFRAAGGKSDRFDAFVLCELARTDHHRFRVLEPVLR